MRRHVIANVNRFLTVPPPKLGEVRDSDVIQRPEHVLIKSSVILLQANLYAVHQEIILPNQILLLDSVI